MGTVNKYDTNDYFKNKVTFLNVILTVMVVVLHAKTPERFGLPLDWGNPLIYVITTFTRMAVPSFFFISGMLLFRGYNAQTLPRKLKSRFWTLVIPYLLWNTIYAIIFFLMTRIPQISSRMNMGIAIQTPLEFVRAILFSRHSDLWFVGDLILFTIVSPLILAISKWKYPSLILLALSIIYYFFALPEYKSPLHWAPMYFAGALYGLNMKEMVKNIELRARYNFILAVLGVLFCASLSFALLTESFYLYELVSPFALWVFADYMFGDKISTFNKKQWMNYTFFIFCSHHFLENILQKLCVLAFEPSTFVMNAVYFITPFITIWMLAFVCNIIKNTLFYKLLCGNR